MLRLLLVLVLAGCANGYKNTSGKNLGPLNWTETTQSKLHLPDDIREPTIQILELPGRYVETISFWGGALKYESIHEGFRGFDKISPKEFRKVFGGWTYSNNPIPHESFEPISDYPLQKARFFMGKTECTAFSRTIGKRVIYRKRGFLYGFFCGWSEEGAIRVARDISVL